MIKVFRFILAILSNGGSRKVALMVNTTQFQYSFVHLLARQLYWLNVMFCPNNIDLLQLELV